MLESPLRTRPGFCGGPRKHPSEKKGRVVLHDGEGPVHPKTPLGRDRGSKPRDQQGRKQGLCIQTARDTD